MKELQQQQLDQVSRANFLLDQLTYNLPGLLIWGAGLYWLFATAEGKPYRFAGWAVVLVLAFLTAARGKSYYAMSAYPVLFACGAVAVERITAGRLSWRWGLVAFSIIVGCYIDTIALPMLPPEKLVRYYKRNPVFRQLGFLRWEDQQDHPLPQDFADMLGWKELAQKTARVYQSLDRSRDTPVVDADNYGEAGALDYYGPAYGLPASMGHSANYLLWTPQDFYNHDSYILTTDDREEIHGDFIKLFASAIVADSVCTPYAREFGSYILLMKGPSAAARKRWEDYYLGLRREISVFAKE